MLSASWKLPSFDAPSPKKQTTTRSVPLSFCGQRRADRDGHVAADDAGRAQVAVLHVGDVHRAALALAVAARLAEHLGHHLVVVRLLLLVRLGGRVAVRVAVTVAAVRAGDQVVVAQRGDRADGDGLLAGVEVRRALQDGLGQQAGDLLLQRANLAHLPQVVQQIGFGQLLLLDEGRELHRVNGWQRMIHEEPPRENGPQIELIWLIDMISLKARQIGPISSIRVLFQTSITSAPAERI